MFSGTPRLDSYSPVHPTMINDEIELTYEAIKQIIENIELRQKPSGYNAIKNDFQKINNLNTERKIVKNWFKL